MLHDPAKSLFLACIRLSKTDDCQEFLDRACHTDPGIRNRVKALLKAQRRDDSFLEYPALAATIDAAPEAPGTQIGPYKLLQQIGEGGFGVVYMAEQTTPVRRKVALKIIKPGMDTKEVIARFEAERQALALMDHPNIARVLDAGTTEEREHGEPRGVSPRRQTSDDFPRPTPPGSSGRPYFVMDLVHGIHITEFCDMEKLSTRERLALFNDVCRAVRHAHQKGIIHRDLKPSNILVTLHDGKPVPKVIDFGVSKALCRPLTEKTLFTIFGQMVGTPLYMSPEQAELSDLDVDTRSDVYALGVVLYELLTGTTPFEKETLKTAGFDELRRIIREDDPPRPSARISTFKLDRLSTVSDQRKTDARRFGQSLRGELDWIVMKALEKDRNRRYESASAFAADVERYLADEAVLACPPSIGYRLSKFVRRHRVFVITSAVIVISLVLTTAGAALLFEEQKESQRQREIARTEKKLSNTRAELLAVQKRMAAESQKNVRLHQYVTRINRAAQAWRRQAKSEAESELKKCIPSKGQKDLRDFAWRFLLKQCKEHVRFESQHSGVARCVDGSSAAGLVASGGDDGVRVSRLKTGKVIRLLSTNEQTVNAVAFSADGTRLAAGCEDGLLRFWSTTDWRFIAALKHPAPIVDLKSVPGRSWIAAAIRGSSVHFWDWQRLTPVRTSKVKRGTLTTLAVSSNGHLVAAGTTENDVYLWSARDGKLNFVKNEPEGVLGLAFAHRNFWIAVGHATGNVTILDTNAKKVTNFSPYSRNVSSIAFSPPDDFLVIASKDSSTVSIYRGQFPMRLLNVYQSRANVTSLRFIGESQLLSASQGGRVNSWQIGLRSGGTHVQLKQGFALGRTQIAFVQGPRLIATAKNKIPIIQFPLHETYADLPDRFSRETGLIGFASSPDGRYLAGICARISPARPPPYLVVWQVGTWKEQFIIPLPVAGNFVRQHRWRIEYTADGSCICVARLDKAPDLWIFDARSGRQTKSKLLEKWQNSAAFRGVWFCPDGVHAIVNAERTVLCKISQPTNSIQALPDSRTAAFSPDGSLFALGHVGGFSIWNLKDLEERVFVGQPASVNSMLQFSPDGRILATAIHQGPVTLWNVATGRKLLQLSSVRHEHGNLAFSLDGDVLATGGDGNSIAIWDSRIRPRP